MDDLFQGLLSMGRGHMKTQRTPEEGLDPLLPPFGRVFEEGARIAGTDAAITVPSFDTAPAVPAGPNTTSDLASLGVDHIGPTATPLRNAESLLGQMTGEAVQALSTPKTGPVLQQGLPGNASSVAALQAAALSSRLSTGPDPAAARDISGQTLSDLAATNNGVVEKSATIGHITGPLGQNSPSTAGSASTVADNALQKVRNPAQLAGRMVASPPLSGVAMPAPGMQNEAPRTDPSVPNSAPIAQAAMSTDRASLTASPHETLAGQTHPKANPALQNPLSHPITGSLLATGSAQSETESSPANTANAARPTAEPSNAPAPNTAIAAPASASKAPDASYHVPSDAPDTNGAPLTDRPIGRPDRAERFVVEQPIQYASRPTATPALVFAAQTTAGTTTATPSTGTDFDAGIEPLVTLQTAAHAPSATLSGPVPTAFQAPPNAPALVAQQIAAALQDRADPGQPLELALDPPELGRVRLHMAELAGVLTLTIHAERPETAELMRRHLDLLAQEFSDAGVDAPSVRISQDGAEGQSGEQNQSERSETDPNAPTDAPSPAPHTRPANGSGTLDLRL
ncbi:flagellar hook-length control protein FliK [Gymnodinialimonas ulvae]|uniref:flagellar hook-length control protein FliK n=1 Tax=Gymnodinialimonas ulvae TaxID=3126504 RepID=UPI0030A1DE6E